MTLYRSTLLLLTCVTCLGANPSAARSYPGVRLVLRSEAHRTFIPHVATLAQLTTGAATLLSNVAAPPATLATFIPGSEGPAVKQLQTTLRLLGYFGGAVNGVYGESTVVAGSKFQQAMGLSTDGVAGSTTLNRLQKAQVPQTPPSLKAQPALEDTAPDQTAERSWVVWLLTVLAIAGTGTGLLYWWQRRTHSPNQPIAALPLASQTPVHAEPHVQEVEPADSPFVNSTNGHNSNAPPETGNSTSAPITVGETKRLSRINIVDELIKELRSPDPAKRRKAIWELGQRGDTQAVQPLVDLMIDSDSKQRSLILASLSEIGVRTLKPMNRALAISLQDENPEVRKNAIRDVTRIYDLVVQISHLLRHATEDPDPEVQETARWALGQVNRIRTAANTGSVPTLQNSVSPPESLPERFPENMES